MITYHDVPNIENGSNCKLVSYYVVCKFKDKQDQFLRMFMLKGHGLVELTGIENGLRKYTETLKDRDTTATFILDFTFDRMAYHNLSIIFQTERWGKLESTMIRAVFSHNSNNSDDQGKLLAIGHDPNFSAKNILTKMLLFEQYDNQLVFMAYEPKYIMFSVDDLSYYEFPYFEVEGTPVAFEFAEYRLASLIYLNHFDKKTYLVVIRIT